MMIRDQIYAQALTMAGELEGQQAALLLVLSRTAEVTLASRLKKGVSPEDCLGDFVSAGALLALAALSEAGETETVEAFTAGDLSIRKNRNSAAANCLRYHAGLLMAPSVADRFVFLGV